MGLGACLFLGLLAALIITALGLSGCGAPAPVIEADVADVVRSKARLGKDIIAGPLATVHPDPVADGGCPR